MPDLDSLLAYETPKVVRIKDRWLGLVRFLFVGLIVFYIFIWQILYKGNHLEVADVDGVFRLQLHHPTKDLCSPYIIGCEANFTPYTELPYCAESKLPYSSPDGTKQSKRTCQFWDSIEAAQNIDQGMLLPTRIRRYEEKRGCEPSAQNGWTCTEPYYSVDANKRRQTQKGPAKPMFDAYVADLENFKLFIDHTFRRYMGMQRDDKEMVGYWLDCPFKGATSHECKKVPILCAHDECPPGATATDLRPASFLAANVSARRATAVRGAAQIHVGAALDGSSDLGAQEILTEENPVMSFRFGDTFLLKGLLRMAFMDLDANAPHEGTYRDNGIVLVIHIGYENRPADWLGLKVLPWSYPEPYYMYQVSTRKTEDYKMTKVFDDPAATHRTVRTYNGIRVVVEQSGKIAIFSWSSFLVTFTGALALTAVATTITEALMKYVMPKKASYSAWKFATTEDMNPDDGGGLEIPPKDEEELKKYKQDPEKWEAELRAAAVIMAIESDNREALVKRLPELLEKLGVTRKQPKSGGPGAGRGGAPSPRGGAS